MTAYKLNKDDVAALRKAGQVSFHYHVDKGAHICASKERGIGTTSESRWQVSIPVDNRATLYTEDGSSYRHELESAFEMVSSAQHHETWMTIARLIKANDTLKLHWIAGGKSNGNTKDRGLHADELVLIVERGGNLMHFIVDVSINPGNTARMVKIRPKKEEAA